MDRLLLSNQPFECLIKGFRLSRGGRRKHWPDGDHIYYSKRYEAIYYYQSSSDTESEWDPDNLGQQLMANDWEIYLL